MFGSDLYIALVLGVILSLLFFRENRHCTSWTGCAGIFSTGF